MKNTHTFYAYVSISLKTDMEEILKNTGNETVFFTKENVGDFFKLTFKKLSGLHDLNTRIVQISDFIISEENGAFRTRVHKERYSMDFVLDKYLKMSKI